MRKRNDAGVRPNGRYVLYWMRSNRRLEANHALYFAAGLANRLALPLLVFESLSCAGPYANDRHHTFTLEGVPALAAAFRKRGIGYAFHLPRRPEEERRALDEAASAAAAVVIDDYPDSVSRHLAEQAPDLDAVETYAVDSSCVVPSAAICGRSHAAFSIRPRIHRLLPAFLKPVPAFRVEHRNPGLAIAFHTEVTPENIPALVASCRIDHAVPPSLSFRGGRLEATRRLAKFLKTRLHQYAALRNEPSAHATSGLSPYLHFGHISSLEVALAARDYAREHKIVADEFLEELIVRRELAFNFAWNAAAVDRLDELPAWARATLDKHRRDPRQPCYTPAQFEAAETQDDLWNATQKELLLGGTIHGYYRMYWGKKILEWSDTPEQALATMVHLHDRYALDGRDPNTYANILWCFGLHDRPWPERPVYGSVRSMTRAGMDRKTGTQAYIKEIGYLERTGKEFPH